MQNHFISGSQEKTSNDPSMLLIKKALLTISQNTFALANYSNFSEQIRSELSALNEDLMSVILTIELNRSNDCHEINLNFESTLTQYQLFIEAHDVLKNNGLVQDLMSALSEYKSLLPKAHSQHISNIRRCP